MEHVYLLISARKKYLVLYQRDVIYFEVFQGLNEVGWTPHAGLFMYLFIQFWLLEIPLKTSKYWCIKMLCEGIIFQFFPLCFC